METGRTLRLFLVISIGVAACHSKEIKLSKKEYLEQRSALISSDFMMRTGASVVLSDWELKVNETLMMWKEQEMNSEQGVNGTFPPALHFFKAKQFIEESQVFQLIRNMPKGAALHVHDSALVDIHWVIKKGTYDEKCYMCFNKDNILLFQFFSKPPSNKECNWTSVIKMRAQSGSPAKFDEELYRNLTLLVSDPELAYPDGNAAWKRFQSLFLSLNGLVFYEPLARSYTYEALQEFYDDNVQYVEMRGLLPQVYDSDGTFHDKEFIVEIYQNESNHFVKDHPDFFGLRVIPTSSRSPYNESVITADILDVIQLRKKFPGFILGYDIVGHEDRGASLLSYIDSFLYPSQHGIDLPYFFHAGETNFEDSSVDLNLFDALLLNTTRFGHGFAIVKHPALLDMIRKRNVPIEICPISNQVLGLVRDLRNHPGAVLMAKGDPIVISSDDPALWNATGLSYDYYEAFMGLGGLWADLATLKQLAINSIMYSGLSPSEKLTVYKLWEQKWTTFIIDTVKKMSLQT